MNEITKPPKGKYYICQKESCRLWKHTDEEQNKSKASTRDALTMTEAAIAVLKNASDSMLSTAKEMRISTIKLFEALILDANDVNNTDDSDSEQESDSCYIMLLRTLTVDEATSTSAELANKVYAHLLITTPQTIPRRPTHLAIIQWPPLPHAYTSKYSWESWLIQVPQRSQLLAMDNTKHYRI